MRHDEHGWDPKGPQQLLDVRAGLDAAGRIVAWETEMWVPNAAPGARALFAAEAARIAQEHGTGSGAITQNGDPPYDAANVRGIAYMRYKQAENYVAMAMEVAVDPATGAIQVRRVTCAHDCGLIVNPDGLRNQVEGCIVQTLSRALHEEVTFDRSRVTSVDWASYPILRFPEAPAVDVILIDRPDQPLLGAGEAATAPVAAALGNAVFDATGVRLRTVPFTAERVKAALAAKPTSSA